VITVSQLAATTDGHISSISLQLFAFAILASDIFFISQLH
jgi:hypothetical protein